MFSSDFLTLPLNAWQEWAGIMLFVDFQPGIGQEFF